MPITRVKQILGGGYIYKVMLVFRLGSTSYLACIGMDYINKAMFVIRLYSPNDKVQVNYNTDHYPEELITHLKQESKKIDEGFYSIRTWEMNLYNNQNDEFNFLVNLDE
ncbi:hypothetical protein [Priestia megaterium]|uniref:hypothetical protein n=1 Tax=Priestia megaterium TaxID=1404 RepID=UPI002EBF4C95|nr:hypothetical protein [Priestia megaterium]